MPATLATAAAFSILKCGRSPRSCRQTRRCRSALCATGAACVTSCTLLKRTAAGLNPVPMIDWLAGAAATRLVEAADGRVQAGQREREHLRVVRAGGVAEIDGEPVRVHRDPRGLLLNHLALVERIDDRISPLAALRVRGPDRVQREEAVGPLVAVAVHHPEAECTAGRRRRGSRGLPEPSVRMKHEIRLESEAGDHPVAGRRPCRPVDDLRREVGAAERDVVNDVGVRVVGASSRARGWCRPRT